ncbi:MAG TPA: HD domain-containing phosphohydrolase [Solirubrobacteraceae bacterium]|nr:HD domain-containing phosphohydrolase [Solirubrobacteraceae bacterium]
MAVLTGVGGVLAASVLLPQLRRLIERGNADMLMTSWCCAFVGLATTLCLLDGELASPFVGVLFVSVAFAAVALPRRLVIVISTLNVLALGVVGLDQAADARSGLTALVLWAAGLIATALVGASISGDRTDRARALRESQEEIVHRLARVVEFRDTDTGGHVERMSRYSTLIASELGFSAERCRELRLAAALHDVGKVAVPDAILLKPGRLTAEERRIMQRHCQAGFDMLTGSDSTLLNLAAEIALTHHERYDGAGYPSGLSGTAIPLDGRIVAVADVFDALTSARVYKDAIDIPDAVEIILEGRGTQFDSDVVYAFVCQLDAVRALHAGNETVSVVQSSTACTQTPLMSRPLTAPPTAT